MSATGARRAGWSFGCVAAIVLSGASWGCGGGHYKPAPLQPQVCSGIDLQPASAAMDERALLDFLKSQGVQTRTEQKRGDLVYVEVLNPENSKWVRLRVAILASPVLAGKELHDAMLQHKKGSWGVHRGNLAVLGPVSAMSEILGFAGKTKLACWGVLTIAASEDEAVVVPGGYREI